MKIKSAVIENDILNIYFDDFKVSFRYKSFESKMNRIYYDNHFTTAFTNIQYVVTVEIKNKKKYYKFASKNHEFGFFEYDLQNKIQFN